MNYYKQHSGGNNEGGILAMALKAAGPDPMTTGGPLRIPGGNGQTQPPGVTPLPGLPSTGSNPPSNQQIVSLLNTVAQDIQLLLEILQNQHAQQQQPPSGSGSTGNGST